MSIDYARLLRSDWDKLGPSALAREIYNTLNVAPATSGEATTTTTTTATGSGNAFVGTVVSGTGATYQVSLNNGSTVSATVPGILSTEVIPAGAVAPVIQLSDSSYRLIFPLWLAQ